MGKGRDVGLSSKSVEGRFAGRMLSARYRLRLPT